jgi:hypothetical protein
MEILHIINIWANFYDDLVYEENIQRIECDVIHSVALFELPNSCQYLRMC